MTIEEVNKYYMTIKKTSFIELKQDLITAAIKYATIRSEWSMMTRNEKLEKDSYRTLSHNSFISICNALSRNMSKVGEDSTWRNEIGNDRKIIGDFACYINCIVGLENA